MQTFTSIDDLVGFLSTKLVEGSAHDRWSIDASISDRTNVLHEVADSITASGSGLVPIVVLPPERSFDTGAVGLAQIVDGITRLEDDRRLADHLADPMVAWTKKHGAVRDHLSKFRDRIVIVSNEPDHWFPAFGDRLLFSKRAEEVAALLTHQASCRVIVTGRDRHQAARVKLRRKDPANVLVDGSRSWNSLTEEARLLHQSLAHELKNFPIADICLLVALQRVTSPQYVRRLVLDFTPIATLAQLLAAEVGRQPEYEGVLDIWESLSVARRPFEMTVVEEVIAQLQGLDTHLWNSEANDLLRCCLLQPVAQKIEMPSLLRMTGSELLQHRVIDAHSLFARHYAEKAQNGPVQSLLVDEMEAYHHASLAESPGIMTGLRPFFSDQLDAWGRSLSQRCLYPEAVEAFERAIAWDPEDDYAYHYAAFNLDIEGREADRVERHYSAAIELDSSNVWWRSRFICFLITRGRISDARRAWSEALQALVDRGNGEKSFLFEHLHIWVARLLLHRMRLDFARDVLASIPKAFRESIPRIIVLDHHLRHLEAADHGRTVRPFRSPLDPRPEDRPERAALRDDAHQELVRWLPGRVEEIDEHLIHIAVGIPKDGAEAEIGRASMPRADFDRFSSDERSVDIEAGRFIELAYYGSSEVPVIRVLHRYPVPDPLLPPLGFNPNRYLRRMQPAVG